MNHLTIQIRHFRDGKMVGEGGSIVRFSHDEPPIETKAYSILLDEAADQAALLCQALAHRSPNEYPL